MARADYRKPDYYARKARQEGYAARSVFKLGEVDEAEGLFRPGMRVLDLGASPGSWMQYASERVGSRGVVVGVDLKPLSRPARANERFILADVNALGPESLREHASEFELVLSDMMPSTIGHKESDHYRSVVLAEAALALCDLLLRPGGNFLVKVFQGPDFNAYRDQLRHRFAKVKIKKPESSRKTSREIYLLGLGKKAGNDERNGG
jgi:23S rRNA (uridine2552-2'-O)-methyltransferase